MTKLEELSIGFNEFVRQQGLENLPYEEQLAAFKEFRNTATSASGRIHSKLPEALAHEDGLRHADSLLSHLMEALAS